MPWMKKNQLKIDFQGKLQFDTSNMVLNLWNHFLTILPQEKSLIDHVDIAKIYRTITISTTDEFISFSGKATTVFTRWTSMPMELHSKYLYLCPYIHASSCIVQCSLRRLMTGQSNENKWLLNAYPTGNSTTPSKVHEIRVKRTQALGERVKKRREYCVCEITAAVIPCPSLVP